MLVLAVDTTSEVGSVAVLGDAELLHVASVAGNETHSVRLFRQLRALLKEAGIAMPEFDLYAVAAGPGSFTGVRVGLAAVKGWAEVYGKPIAAVSTLQAVAAQVEEPARLIAAVADARRGQMYTGLYERNGGELRRRGEDVVMPPAECFDYLAGESRGESLLLATPAPDWLAPLLVDSAMRGVRIESVSAVLAPTIGLLGMERARRGEVVDAASLDAHYVRRSAAELLWKAH